MLEIYWVYVGLTPVDLNIEELERLQRRIEEQAEIGSGEIDKLTGLIEVKERDLTRLRQRVDQFDFYEIEKDISQATVDEIETNIAQLNKERYQLQSRLQEIARSLESRFEFEPDKIKQLFEEVGVLLPDTLGKSYEDLVAFNRRLTSGRSERLKQLQIESNARLSDIADQLDELNAGRKRAMVALQQRETLEKYKRLVERLRLDEQEVAVLTQRLAKLDSVSSLEAQRDTLMDQRKELVRSIKSSVRRGNARYRRIRDFFSRAFESIVDAYAVMSVAMNKKDNLEFEIQTLDRQRGHRKTGEGKGFSYRKLLCVCFDLALVVSYRRAFYRFIYHDGVFEALDNRKKVALTDLVRTACKSDGIQYFLTVIDTDLPRDERDSKLLFSPEEIIRELHDDGPEGRLFRMRKF